MSEPRMARPWKNFRRWKTGWLLPDAEQLAWRTPGIRFCRSFEVPVEPGQLVVLAVGVVVAVLACGRARRRRSIIGTPCESSSVARRFRFCRSRSAMIVGVVGRALGAAVPAVVVVGAVAVLLAVGLVVLLVVADEVVRA